MGAQAVRLSNVDIDNAIKNKDFEVLFQPIFDLGNGALARMETFVRWRHKTLGLLPPGAFISFFETQGRMSELTRYVLSAALTAYMDWRGAYAPGFSINLALSDLGDEAFVGHFRKLLRDHDFPADLVTLECPMPPVDMDADIAAAHFKALSETGARLAIEVRGRANEFLRTVNPFPFDEIKTGGASILRFARTVRGPGLSAIADLLDIAHQANAAITAVGVEDQTSLVALRGLGFTAAQGNHLGKVGALKDFMPCKVNDVRALLKLDPLDADSLNALFRSAAPGTDAGVLSAIRGAADAAQERLAEADGEPSEEERKTRAREKARKLALAKRAKTRAARKAAAIERVKARTAAQSDLLADLDSEPPADASKAGAAKAGGAGDDGDPFGPSLAPRDMQQRIAKEFAHDAPPSEGAAPGEDRPAPAAQRPPKAAPPPPLPDEKVTAAPAKRAAKGVIKAEPSEDGIDNSKTGAAGTAKDAPPKPAAPPKQRPAMADKAPSASAPIQRPPSERRAGPAQRSAQAAKPAASLVDALPPQAKSQTPKSQAASETPERPAAIKLNVPTAGARFSPEIRVAGPLPGNGPAMAAERAAPAASEIRASDVSPPEFAEAPPPETGAGREDAPPLAAPARRPDAEDDALFGDLHRTEEEHEEAPARPVHSAPRRKNFLTRKYRLTPTHFWPKSWKRRYRRMKARQAAARKDEAPADAPSAE